MPKIKNGKFFAEIILLSIFSIVAAGLWLDWTRGVIATHFQNNPYVVLGLAITITLVGMLAMRSFFANYSMSPKEENIEKYAHHTPR